MEANNIIAYLAPEIPSVSGTFVYKEILALEKKGIKIIPISVHKITSVELNDPQVRTLSERTEYLYQQSLITALFTSLFIFINRPKSYFNTLLMVLADINNVGIVEIKSWKLLYQFLYSSIVAKAILKNSCQYMHIHFAHFPTQIGMYASALTGIPFSFTCHANDIFENKFLLKEKAERAKAVITISEYNYKYLLNLGISVDKLKVVRCGIDTCDRDFITKSEIKFPLKIGSLGRLIEKKGMDDLILACSKLHQQNLDFQLEIGGDGPLNNRLQELIKTHDLSSNVVLKGAIPNDRVYDWFSSLDVFVLACKQNSQGDRDGIPVVLMEAMYVGIPVISTSISGIPELIQDGKSGFLAQPNDPESLAQTLNDFVQQAHSISEITKGAREKVLKEFELDSNVEQLLGIFKA
ncbi:putative glycosyltransferase [Chondrocystis sp. NIES-4102]|nr:putative glycosyltransferase [Chondrocystis sp. NIES-4102]